MFQMLDFCTTSISATTSPKFNFDISLESRYEGESLDIILNGSREARCPGLICSMIIVVLLYSKHRSNIICFVAISSQLHSQGLDAGLGG